MNNTSQTPLPDERLDPKNEVYDPVLIELFENFPEAFWENHRLFESCIPRRPTRDIVEELSHKQEAGLPLEVEQRLLKATASSEQRTAQPVLFPRAPQGNRRAAEEPLDNEPILELEESMIPRTSPRRSFADYVSGVNEAIGDFFGSTGGRITAAALVLAVAVGVSGISGWQYRSHLFGTQVAQTAGDPGQVQAPDLLQKLEYALQPVLDTLTQLVTRLGELERSFSAEKEAKTRDVAGLQKDVGALRGDVDGLKQRLETLKTSPAPATLNTGDLGKSLRAWVEEQLKEPSKK